VFFHCLAGTLIVRAYPPLAGAILAPFADVRARVREVLDRAGCAVGSTTGTPHRNAFSLTSASPWMLL
jgi:hypothetical protein